VKGCSSPLTTTGSDILRQSPKEEFQPEVEQIWSRDRVPKYGHKYYAIFPSKFGCDVPVKYRKIHVFSFKHSKQMSTCRPKYCLQTRHPFCRNQSDKSKISEKLLTCKQRVFSWTRPYLEKNVTDKKNCPNPYGQNILSLWVSRYMYIYIICVCVAYNSSHPKRHNYVIRKGQ
jgi:hypothetical protein